MCGVTRQLFCRIIRGLTCIRAVLMAKYLGMMFSVEEQTFSVGEQAFSVGEQTYI
jgi:hypothetical protein